MLRLSILFLCFAAMVPVGIAQAASPSEMLASEEAFLATWGDRAHPAAPGVWTVETSPGIELRVAFGDKGLESDRAHLREQVEALELHFLNEGGTPALEKRAARLRTVLERLDAESSAAADKVAITGVVGQNCHYGTGYEFNLEGVYRTGSTGPEVYAYADVGLGLDFGPYAPWYPDRFAYTEIVARTKTNSCRYAFGADEETHGWLGIAIASSRIACGPAGWNCSGWRTESWTSVGGCADSYRSLSVSSGLIGICELY